MKVLLLSTAFALPLATTAALAAGGGNETAPEKPKCETGQVYDKATKTCIVAKDSNLDVDTLYETVRELAYAGRYADAQVILAEMPQTDDRTLTYLGFVHRKMGNAERAMGHYREALVLNPDNVLARSYMGQGFVEAGNIAAAMDQLRAIRAHGGSGTWAEASLRQAIATGRTFSY
ncbi:hypothetical protein FIU94_11585 [Sulfitobacter sp. THAF37]|uniref:tetratricopeptide repeat protein n=1 Tax=Sulfitobacter sp. THAF37 TaxID=2587855 RepID=UPI001267F553|nr:tetratricopeptide repeat protein [Sulfitobacter sp. THAF37]QFT59466.1 hypothetical protein FIU94_11585 [Sulfitobacter sp. THAF37]